MIKKYKSSLLIILSSLFFISSLNDVQAQASYGKAQIDFTFSANHKTLHLIDSLYKNGWGEYYSISKIKYYVSSFILDDYSVSLTTNKYSLIDAYKNNNLVDLGLLPAGRYNRIRFTIGVDSIDNCQGAQNGVLDPINDMFWAWNSGYVFFKLEGNSNSSNSDLNRIEYHIGGYKKRNAANRNIDLLAKTPIEIDADNTSKINIELDLDKMWDSVSQITIKETPICVSPGELACRFANNFIRLFSIKNELH